MERKESDGHADAVRAGASAITTPVRAALTPAQVAMILIEHVEKTEHAELLPVDPDRAAFVARWPATPRTLVELWDFCGGERTNVLFVLARAAMRSFPAPRERGSQLGSISEMKLSNPGTLVWEAEHAPLRDVRIRASWVQLADAGNDVLFIDEQGTVRLWSSEIDYPVLDVHPSFDAWMLETAVALRDGVVKIAPAEQHPARAAAGTAGRGRPAGERVIRGDFSYEFGAGGWWDEVRRREP